MVYDDEDIDELRLRVGRLVKAHEMMILRNAALKAAGEKLADAADAYCRDAMAFALHGAVADWRAATSVAAVDPELIPAEPDDASREWRE